MCECLTASSNRADCSAVSVVIARCSDLWQPAPEYLGRVASDKLLFDRAGKSGGKDAMDMAASTRRQSTRLAVAPTAFGQGVVGVLNVHRCELGEWEVAERWREEPGGRCSVWPFRPASKAAADTCSRWGSNNRRLSGWPPSHSSNSANSRSCRRCRPAG